MDSYHFNIPKILINIIHIIVGVWIAYLGYKTIKNIKIEKYNYNILVFLGILLLIYFIYLFYKNINKIWNYSFAVPNFIVFGLHIINGILFILLGLKKIELKDLFSLYLIISGSLGALYHKHIIYYNMIKK